MKTFILQLKSKLLIASSLFYILSTQVYANNLPLLSYNKFNSYPSKYCKAIGPQYSIDQKIKVLIDLEKLQSLESERTSTEVKKQLKAQIMKSFDIYGDKANFKVQHNLDKKLKEFLVIGSKIDPTIKEKDLYRAKTNMWPIFVLQHLFFGEMEITDAAIGFSMLYPYTDNIIDDIHLSKEEKKKFVMLFGQKIREGAPSMTGLINSNRVNSVTQIEHYSKIWEMFNLIEGQYPREQYKDLYLAMSYLHKAQIDSQVQQILPLGTLPPFTDEYEQQVFDVTMRKGYGSILSDGYLVKGHLTEDEKSFTGHFGAITQFINDMVAITEDIEQEGHFTPLNLVYIKALHNRKLKDNHKKHLFDQAVNHIFYYIDEVFNTHTNLFNQSEAQHQFYMNVKYYLNIKFLMAIAKNKNFHSKKFINHIQNYTPLPLSILKLFNKIQETGVVQYSDEQMKSIKVKMAKAVKKEYKELLSKKSFIQKRKLKRKIKKWRKAKNTSSF